MAGEEATCRYSLTGRFFDEPTESTKDTEKKKTNSCAVRSVCSVGDSYPLPLVASA